MKILNILLLNDSDIYDIKILPKALYVKDTVPKGERTLLVKVGA